MAISEKLIKEAEQFRDNQKAGGKKAKKLVEAWSILAAKLVYQNRRDEAEALRDAMIDKVIAAYGGSLKGILVKS